jgi:alkanesulfonate monooxygenase SsuD/methylene tetrahydromethanopterin reductase-like flavin-dependent oxidoreductase (luciferase family)
MKIGFAIDPLPVDKTVQTARFLESSGFASIWLSDETLVFNSPPEMTVPELFPTLAMIAAATKKVKIGTAAIDASIRHPVKTAQSVATVDTIAKGRMMVGIGGGEAGNREPFGMPLDHPYARLEETVKVMKLLFGADHRSPVSFRGKYYSLDDAYLKIKPARKAGPPILVSAFGPRALNLAGELGDGWLSFAHTPDSFHTTLTGPISESARRAHRSLNRFETALVVLISVSKDKSAKKNAARVAKDWLVWSPDNMKLIVPSVENQLRQPYAKSNDPAAVKRLAKLANEIPDSVAQDLTISGTEEECIEQLKRFEKAGLRHAILYALPLNQSWKSAVTTISKKIVPHFTSA